MIISNKMIGYVQKRKLCRTGKLSTLMTEIRLIDTNIESEILKEDVFIF